jgi:hypothetical protein
MKLLSIIESIINEGFYQYIPVKKVNRFVYHVSAPIFSDKISKEGLLPQRGDQWLTDTKIEGKTIFATNSDKKEDWFEPGYDDDIYRIDTSKINNQWYYDPNFFDEAKDTKEIFTFGSIPKNAIKLIHAGSGDNLI